MKTKHSKGPWMHELHWDKDQKCRNWIRSTGAVVAYIPNNPRAQYKANAQLIAAAPELYDALQALMGLELYNALGQVYPPKVEPLIAKALLALMKARGE